MHVVVNFHLRLFLFFLCFSVISIHYHTQKQNKKLPEIKSILRFLTMKHDIHSTELEDIQYQISTISDKNTLPLICMSLNKNSIYCVMLRSSKNADQRKQWWYRVAGYSAVAPSSYFMDKE